MSDTKFGTGVGVGVGVSALCATIALLTGVVVLPVDEEPAAAVSPAASAAPQPDDNEKAPTPDPTKSDSAAPPPSDQGGQTEERTEAPLPSDGGGQTPTPATEQIDLMPQEGTLYLRAIQGFSPELETWVVDLDSGTVEYQRYSCLGMTEGIGVGVIAPDEDDRYTIEWEGDKPTPLSGRGSTQQITMTERTLDAGVGMASTHHEVELERIRGMCREAGETVAGFVL